MDTFNESLGLKIPGHVAVILDGNGRWAKKRHLPRTMGHVQGSKVVEDMLYVVDELGVKYFTVYAFSTENWKRSTEEVSTLMGILRTYLKDCVKKSMKNNVRCRVIGRKDELSQDIIDIKFLCRMLCKDIFFAACPQIPILHLVYHNTSFKSSKNVGFQRIFGEADKTRKFF